jgi:hypothetical protein
MIETMAMVAKNRIRLARCRFASSAPRAGRGSPAARSCPSSPSAAPPRCRPQVQRQRAGPVVAPARHQQQAEHQHEAADEAAQQVPSAVSRIQAPSGVASAAAPPIGSITRRSAGRSRLRQQLHGDEPAPSAASPARRARPPQQGIDRRQQDGGAEAGIAAHEPGDRRGRHGRPPGASPPAPSKRVPAASDHCAGRPRPVPARSRRH